MKYKPLSELGVGSALDLCALSHNPPPLSFKDDLNLPPHCAPAIQYRDPHLDKDSYWQPGYHA